MSEKPVIVLAYSNDHDAYLDMVVRERKNVYNTLRPYHDKDYIQVEKAEHTSIDDFFEIFGRYQNRVAIFHYGGHASGSGLQLEGAGGAVETASAGGLAQLMGQQKNLQLVFLNGCATRGQVEALLEAGVKAVIATAVAINDVKATEFAEQFYRALAGQASIEKAFNTAKSFIATKYASAKEIKKSKGLKLKKKENGAAEELPWGLYTDDESTLEWKLPTMAHNKLIVRGGGFQGKKIQLNVKFIQTLFKALAPLNDNIQFLLEQAKKKKKMDIRRVRQEIVDSYPAPVGEQLRKLFASNEINVTRLKQLVHSYDVTAQLLCFTMLSQLWDCKMNQELNFLIEEEDLVGFNSFMSISSESQPTFDYANMMNSIYHIFTQNNIAPFITELGDFVKNLNEGGSLYEPNLFMMEMKKELVKGVSAEELESFCLQAEAQLTKIMKECAFFVSYKLITIKHIEIIKKRHESAMYKLNNVMLDRVTAGVLDDVMELGTYTDDRSVIFVRNTENMEDYLNVTPFVVDENALTGNEKSKLYFYAYKEDEKYIYQFIDNSAEKLEISEETFDDINNQMNNFQKSIFDKEGELIDIEDEVDMDFFDDDDDDDEFGFELE
jgi:hypothetical protein